MSWTPYQIEIVLHHHVSPTTFPRSAAPAYSPTVSDLIHDGILIDRDDGAIETTELGRALVGMWCAQPIPVASFIDPRFGHQQGRVMP
ncbi:hypothetical protein [Mesorhizobium sp. A556]